MKNPGRKIWFGTAMVLSGIVLILCVASIVGVWIVEQALANTVVRVLVAANEITESLRGAADGVDQKLERMQEVSSFISIASDRLSQKVIDEGVLLQLLPEEKEQNLAELATSVREAISPLRDMLKGGVTIYRSIDQLPFVDLPSPSQEQIDEIGESVGEIQSTADRLEAEIAAFRSGTSGKIDKVGEGADALTARIGQARDRMAALDARLALVQEKFGQIQQTALRALFLGALLITLFLAWLAYSQVEVFLAYRRRWKAARVRAGTEQIAELEASVEAEPADEPATLAADELLEDASPSDLPNLDLPAPGSPNVS